MSEDDKTIDQIDEGDIDSGVTFEVVEPELQQDGQKVNRRGIYLLPNLFTTAGLFAGFFAIIASMNGQFEKAAIAIVIAGMLDVADGGVARLTNSQSEFGAQYDSLHDLVSFGVAPAVLIYAWSLNTLGKLGWMAAFVYVACAALRLARFNSQNQNENTKYFTGLASPASAGTIVGCVYTFVDYEFEVTRLIAFVGLFTCLWCSFLMVSSFKFLGIKQIDVSARVPFAVILSVVIALAIFFIDPPLMMLIIGVVYTSSGPLMSVFRPSAFQ